MHRFLYLNQNQSKEILPTQTLYSYTGYEKYIELQEKFKESINEEILICHYLLDPQLSIIHKKTKEILDINANAQKYTKESNEVAYLIREQKSPIIYTKLYAKYFQLNDFIFGRQHWGRGYNCLRISSDLISRQHAKIIFNNIQLKKIANQSKTIIKTIVKNQTHYSSILRKIPQEMWDKIIEYSLEKPKYLIKDCKSRNGTFLMNCSQQWALLNQGQGYQFESREYTLYVNEILSDKGANILNKITTYMNNWQTNHFHHHNYILKIISESNVLANLPFCQQDFHAIHFQVNYSHHIKYFFWIIENANANKKYNIGHGYQINLMNNVEGVNYDGGLHGYLTFKNNRWQINSIYQNEDIWIKLAPQQEYELSTQNRYRIRLGGLNVIDLIFHNYS